MNAMREAIGRHQVLPQVEGQIAAFRTAITNSSGNSKIQDCLVLDQSRAGVYRVLDKARHNSDDPEPDGRNGQ
jgi:hypothetical protein